MPTEFDFDLHQLRLSRERQRQQELNLSWAHVIFDPAKHPRLRGKFTVSDHKAALATEIGKLKHGQTLAHAESGVKIWKDKNPHYTEEGAAHGQKPDAYYYQHPQDSGKEGYYTGGTLEGAADYLVKAHRSLMKKPSR